MKKVLIIAVTIVAVIALGNVLLASAQNGNPPNQPGGTCPLGYTCPFSGTMPNGMLGRGGMMGGRGMHGMMGAGIYTGTMPMHSAMVAAGGMHEQVWTAIAQELDLTYEQLTQAVQNGQTIAQLAEAQGVELEDLQQAARDAHQAALTDLVEQGGLTQDQADWMLDHLEDMPMLNFEQGFGPGRMHGRGMMGGHGMMQNWQPPTGPQG
jgi:hypothetical protein